MHQPTNTAMTNIIDAAQMTWVPAGEFVMGSSDEDIAAIVRQHPGWSADWFTQETPQQRITLPGYWIYTYPVTVAQYRACCAATGKAMPVEPEWGWHDDHPMVNVNWDDAMHYADWAQAALPTEAHWEKAARGVDGRWWPWGNTWDSARCVNAETATSTLPVGAFPDGASPYGVMDMAGNVWEWCVAAPVDTYNRPPVRQPQRRTPTPSGHVLRGGSWVCAFDAYLRCAYRCFECDTQRTRGAYRRPTNGFRCIVQPKD